jgi:hypothetical protein
MNEVVQLPPNTRRFTFPPLALDGRQTVSAWAKQDAVYTS